jgi:hypothetical protein
MQTDSVAGVGELELANVALTAARSASVSSRRPRKVSGTEMLCKSMEVSRPGGLAAGGGCRPFRRHRHRRSIIGKRGADEELYSR